jgi:hypothetical protein
MCHKHGDHDDCDKQHRHQHLREQRGQAWHRQGALELVEALFAFHRDRDAEAEHPRPHHTEY